LLGAGNPCISPKERFIPESTFIPIDIDMGIGMDIDIWTGIAGIDIDEGPACALLPISIPP
jgi:hypothetical protein